jgi:hypothetical protein
VQAVRQHEHCLHVLAINVRSLRPSPWIIQAGMRSLHSAMSIIILAQKTDAHAAVFAWGLEQLGIEVTIWDGLSWREDGAATVIVDKEICVYLGSRTITDKDTIWFRRPRHFKINPATDRNDHKFAKDQYQAFDNSLLFLLERTGVRCVNEWSSGFLLE